jgi:hypothetical protein
MLKCVWSLFLEELEEAGSRDLDQYVEYHPATKKHKCMLCKFLTNRPAKVLRQPELPVDRGVATTFF